MSTATYKSMNIMGHGSGAKKTKVSYFFEFQIDKVEFSSKVVGALSLGIAKGDKAIKTKTSAKVEPSVRSVTLDNEILKMVTKLSKEPNMWFTDRRVKFNLYFKSKKDAVEKIVGITSLNLSEYVKSPEITGEFKKTVSLKF